MIQAVMSKVIRMRLYSFAAPQDSKVVQYLLRESCLRLSVLMHFENEELVEAVQWHLGEHLAAAAQSRLRQH